MKSGKIRVLEKSLHLIGKTFSFLTILSLYYKKEGRNSRLMAKCRCKCGTDTDQRLDDIQKGLVKSCGCRRHHGQSKTRLYYVYKDMINRCSGKYKYLYLKRYAGRGIRVCKEWQEDPMSFIRWAKENGYKDGLQLDRRDNDKGYSPENCRFVTRTENMRNMSTNVFIEYKGERRTISEWGEILGKNPAMIGWRLRSGWSVNDAIEKPSDTRYSRGRGITKGHLLTYKGETHCILEWARIVGFSWWTIQNRLKLGWSVERIFTTPEKRKRNEN